MAWLLLPPFLLLHRCTRVRCTRVRSKSRSDGPFPSSAFGLVSCLWQRCRNYRSRSVKLAHIGLVRPVVKQHRQVPHRAIRRGEPVIPRESLKSHRSTSVCACTNGSAGPRSGSSHDFPHPFIRRRVHVPYRATMPRRFELTGFRTRSRFRASSRMLRYDFADSFIRRNGTAAERAATPRGFVRGGFRSESRFGASSRMLRHDFRYPFIRRSGRVP